jgi:hypothetical protein
VSRTRSSRWTSSELRDGRARLDAVTLFLVAVGIAAFSTLSVLAPSPDELAATSGFSIDETRRHVDAIATEPHPMGSPAIERVRDYLVAQLTSFGLPTHLQTVSVSDYFGGPGRTVEVTNVIARIPGTGDGTAILVMAHYDTVPTTAGANDNSAAVAAVLEAARVLQTSPPLRNDVILLFTDGEEPAPRFGASAFASDNPWFADAAFAVNLEAIGSSGPDLLLETAGPDAASVDAVASLPAHAAFSFFTSTAELIGGASTDFDVIRDAEIPGLNLAWIRGSSIYHTERDDLDHLNTAGMADHVSTVLGLVRHFGDADLATPADEGALVFFSIPGGFLVRHSAIWIPIGSVAIVLLFILGLSMTIRQRPFSWRSMLRGTGLAVLGCVAAAIVGTLMWMAISAARSTLGVTEGYVWLLMLIGVAGAVWFVARYRALLTGADIGEGILLVWVALSLVTAVSVPTIGYLFVWPALAGTIALAIRSLVSGAFGWRLLSLVIVAVPTFFLITPAIDAFFLFATPRPGNPDSELPAMIVIPMILLYLAIGLTASAAQRSTRS